MLKLLKSLRRKNRKGVGSTLLMEIVIALIIVGAFAPLILLFFKHTLEFRQQARVENVQAISHAGLSSELTRFAREVINMPICSNPDDATSTDECVRLAQPFRAVVPVWQPELGADPDFVPLGCYVANSADVAQGSGGESGIVLRCLYWSAPQLTPLQQTHGNRWLGIDDPPAPTDVSGTLQAVSFPLASGSSLIDPQFDIPHPNTWGTRDDIRRAVFSDIADVVYVSFTGDGPADLADMVNSTACLPILDTTLSLSECRTGDNFGFGRGAPNLVYINEHGVRRAALVVCPVDTPDLNGNNRGDCMDVLDALRSVGYSNALTSGAFSYRYLEYRYDLSF